MSLVNAIRDMLARGMPVEQALLAAEVIEASLTGPKSNAQRQAEWRAREKAKRNESNDAVTDRNENNENVTFVTAPHNTETAPTHAEPEPNKTTSPPPTSEANASSVAPKPAETLPIAKPKAPRGIRLPDCWWPPPETESWCRTDFRLTDQQISEAVDEFRDYWAGVPGSAGCKADWPATFRNAVRRRFTAVSNARGSPAGGNRSQTGGRLGGYQRAAAHYAQ